MPSRPRLRPSLRLVSDACRRALKSLKHDCRKRETSSLVVQPQTLSSLEQSSSKPAEIETTGCCRKNDGTPIRSVLSISITTTTSFTSTRVSFTSPTSDLTKSHEEQNLKIINRNSNKNSIDSKSQHFSLCSLRSSTNSDVPSLSSSISSCSTDTDSELLEQHIKSIDQQHKRFIRIRQSASSYNFNQFGFSFEDDYYNDYLPQFEELKQFTPCQSDTLKSVFEDDDEDDDLISRAKIWFTQKNKK